VSPPVGTVGFVGLGSMGSVLAQNLVQWGLPVVAHDAAGPGRSPAGAAWAGSLAELARRADLVVLCLPDGSASGSVAREIAGAAGRKVSHVVDTSTIGIDAAESIAAGLAAAGVAYLDSPVSGGVAGARARTLAVMYSGPDDVCAHAEPVLAGLSDKRWRVGDRAGLAQAMKLANNFLAALALSATSEAVAFGVSAGLDMRIMLDVLNESSGRNSATQDKFPRQVLPGTYRYGFSNTLMHKDQRLYLQAVAARGCPAEIARVNAALWERFAAGEPGADFTRIYPFVRGTRGAVEPAGAVRPADETLTAPRGG
jgi:3-hydroxyisobutyrate dehydrogenase-like beta-hydroxyacid dehydrogenase